MWGGHTVGHTWAVGLVFKPQVWCRAFYVGYLILPTLHTILAYWSAMITHCLLSTVHKCMHTSPKWAFAMNLNISILLKSLIEIYPRMESLQTYADKFDHGVMDRFLNLSELPVIGTSALEQILHQASLDFNPAMSPDSSQWTASTSGVESGSESLDGRTESDLECLPDSTTRDNKDDDTCSVNSDPINSSGSEYSFAASPPVFEPVLHEEPNNNNASVAQKRKSPSADEAPSKKRSRKSKAGPNELCCPLCEYTTRVKEHLASHMNSHTSDRKYMCNQCGQTFKWSHSLRRHQRTHQKDYKFTCAHCPKTFSRKDHLAVHEKLHDSDNTESYPCPECGVKFKNKKTLTGHVKTHSTDKPHKCDSCDSAFTRKASLTRHVLAAHAGHVFHCDICTAPFSYKSTLEDHRRAVHNEGKRDFHCTACGLSFACKAYLQKHLVSSSSDPDSYMFSSMC